MNGEKCGVCQSCYCGGGICNIPLSGRPKLLSVYAPVVYDEIGLNICRTVTVPEDVLAANPTAACARLDVIDVEFTAASTGIPGTTVTNTARANCSTVVLTNVSVTFLVKLFDQCNNYLTSTVVTANYLPGSTTSPDAEYLDAETNPDSVTVELYTPYGVGYTAADGEPVINTVGFLPDGNSVTNGINATAVAKAMNFNSVTGTFSAGISLFLRTVYYETYKVAQQGKPIPPKASLTEDQNSCLDFVESGLLSREIKPLELEPPKCEGKLKDTESPCEREDGNIVVFNPCGCEPNNDPCNGQNNENSKG
ncbi:MAG: hypothetical protein K6G64_02395 [Eubacterium sp.]|nr:hypothetical protein [Eubacterium sp.]